MELKNDYLESRLSTKEKEIIALNVIRESLDTVKSHFNRLNIDVTSVQSDLRNPESNVSAYGNVFDSVKENTESNRTVISKNRKSINQCIKSQKLTGNRIAEELKKKWKRPAKMENSMTDLKVRPMRNKLIFTGIPEQKGKGFWRAITRLHSTKIKTGLYNLIWARPQNWKMEGIQWAPAKHRSQVYLLQGKGKNREKAAEKIYGFKVWV